MFLFLKFRIKIYFKFSIFYFFNPLKPNKNDYTKTLFY